MLIIEFSMILIVLKCFMPLFGYALDMIDNKRNFVPLFLCFVFYADILLLINVLFYVVVWIR